MQKFGVPNLGGLGALGGSVLFVSCGEIKTGTATHLVGPEWPFPDTSSYYRQ